MKYEISHTTHRGLVRINNEDSLTVKSLGDKNLLAIADGMGGHACGEIASGIIIDHLEENADFILQYSESPEFENALTVVLNKAISECRKLVLKRPECSGMGTTLVLSIISEERVFIHHIGDSRAYHIRDGKVEFMTRDHTVARELYEKGLINAETLEHDPRKHILTRCIGGFSFEELEVEFEYQATLNPMDKILLCSDGLIDMVKDKFILNTVTQDSMSVRDRIAVLLDAALANGGIDNISIILLEARE